ncbi:hypothetical protein IAD21_04316 [Abditibacteriota bacterium]|nr:hypothetical protein IAD21_04316 [Abditibacteriota bacterium]
MVSRAMFHLQLSLKVIVNRTSDLLVFEFKVEMDRAPTREVPPAVHGDRRENK